jgi:hypothetical protein
MGKHRRARARELSELSELESVWNDLWSQLAKQLSEAGDPALSRLRRPWEIGVRWLRASG